MSPRPDEDSTTQANTVTTPDSTAPREDIVVKPGVEDNDAITAKPSLEVSEVKMDGKSEEDTGVEGKAIVEAGGVATLAKILTEKIEKEKIVEGVKTADKAVEVNKLDEHKIVEELKVVESKAVEELKAPEVKPTEAAVVVPMTATSLVYWENPIEVNNLTNSWLTSKFPMKPVTCLFPLERPRAGRGVLPAALPVLLLPADRALPRLPLQPGRGPGGQALHLPHDQDWQGQPRLRSSRQGEN